MQDRTQLLVEEKGLEIIRNIKGPIVPVVVIGAQQTCGFAVLPLCLCATSHAAALQAPTDQGKVSCSTNCWESDVVGFSLDCARTYQHNNVCRVSLQACCM